MLLDGAVAAASASRRAVGRAQGGAHRCLRGGLKSAENPPTRDRENQTESSSRQSAARGRAPHAHRRDRAPSSSSAPRATSPSASSCPRCTAWCSSASCPRSSRSSGQARTPMTDDAFRDKMKQSVARVLGSEAGRRGRVALVRAGALLPALGHRQRRRLQEALRPPRPHRPRARHRRQSALLSLRRAALLRARRWRSSAAPGSPRPKAGSWVRVIIEKPFGSDLASARKLNRDIHESLDESQIYRIDHYLGKETVQNLLALRFANGIFEPLWNRKYIDHVQITVAESGRRGGPRRLLRDGRRAARHDPEPRVPGAVAGGDGAAGAPRLRSRARREDQGDDCGARRSPPSGSTPSACAASTAPGSIAGKPVPGYREEEGVAPRFDHRDVRAAHACTSTTGAGPACRSTCARASACRSA